MNNPASQEFIKKYSSCKAIMTSLDCTDIVQNTPHHTGTLYEHTDSVINALCHGPVKNQVSKELLLAAVFHDTGKPETVTVHPKTGYSQYLGHAERSAEIFEYAVYSNKIDVDGLDSNQIEYTKELIRLHEKQFTKAGKIRQMLNEDEHPDGFARDLITLRFADILGQSTYARKEKLESLLNFADRILAVGDSHQVIGVGEIKSSISEYLGNWKEPEENSFEVRHTCKNDKDVKFTSVHDIEQAASPWKLYQYEKDGLRLCFDGMELYDARINGVNIKDLWSVPPASSPSDTLSSRLTDEQKQNLVDMLNEKENRTKEPYYDKDTLIFLARTADNQNVYVQANDIKKMEQASKVSIAHIREAVGIINKMPQDTPQFGIYVDMGRPVGNERCIFCPTKFTYMVYLKGMEGPAPVIIDSPVDLSTFDVHLKFRTDKNGNYILTDASYGMFPALLPWQAPDLDKSHYERFWNEHALAVSKDDIDYERTQMMQPTKSADEILPKIYTKRGEQHELLR